MEKKMVTLNTGETKVFLLMTGQTPQEIIREVKAGKADGADGVALELSALRPEFRNGKSFSKIIQSVDLPFMFIFYRKDRWNQIAVEDDDSRVKLLLEAAEAGAGIIDVMGDLYSPCPDQCAMEPAAVKKQVALIKKIHSLGSQVIISSHPCRYMTPREVLKQLSLFEERGGDIVKLVADVANEEQLGDAVQTFALLNQELKKPYVYISGGRFGAIHRFLGLRLGSAITFGIHKYHEEYPYNQPLIRDFKEAQKNASFVVKPPKAPEAPSPKK